MEEATTLLERVDLYLAEARARLAPGTQRYLEAEKLLRRASEPLDAVEALFEEIETKAAELAQARQAVEEELTATSGPFEDMKALLMGTSLEDTQSRPVYEQKLRRLSALRSAAQAERPDWRLLRAQVLRLRGETHARVWRAKAEYEAAQRREQLLSSFRRKEPQPTDAERARMALAAADTALHEANQLYGSGVSADLSEAKQSFALAQAHLMNQRYGPAAQAAERVQQELRKAVDAAWSERKRYEAHGNRYLPDIWTATFSKDPSPSSPERPSPGSRAGRSGLGKSRSRRRN